MWSAARTVLNFWALADCAQAFLSSHRNSLEGHLSLLDKIHCNVILLPEGAPAVTYQLIKKRPMHVLSMPAQEEFFCNNKEIPGYPWNGTLEECKDQTLVILHTSGSTGIPKPVYVTHGTFATNDAHGLISSLGGKPTFGDYIQGKRLFVGLPLFHAANLTFTIGLGIFQGVTCVLPPARPLTADIVDKVHLYGNVHGSLLPPSLIADLHESPRHLNNMIRNLQFLSYVGGSLAKEIGDSISSKIQLVTLMGSTETMLYPIELNEDHEDHEDWEYMHISPFFGHTFRSERDGLSELVIVRDEKFRPFQGIFSIFTDILEYRTRDLYEPHPMKKNAWAFRARADDIISFSNAEKLNPVTMEMMISSHPAVRAAVVAGHGQFQACLLVEPRNAVCYKEEQQILLNEIWPTVLKANQGCPAHGRIMKDFVIFTTPDKPIPRTAKGGINRYEVLRMYANEIKALYAARNNSTVIKKSSNNVLESRADYPQTTISLLDIKAKIYSALSRSTYLHDLRDTDDFFQHGLDSLQVTALVTELNSTRPPSSCPLSAQVIYDNPSVERLAAAMRG